MAWPFHKDEKWLQWKQFYLWSKTADVLISHSGAAANSLCVPGELTSLLWAFARWYLMVSNLVAALPYPVSCSSGEAELQVCPSHSPHSQTITKSGSILFPKYFTNPLGKGLWAVFAYSCNFSLSLKSFPPSSFSTHYFYLVWTTTHLGHYSCLLRLCVCLSASACSLTIDCPHRSQCGLFFIHFCWCFSELC